MRRKTKTKKLQAVLLLGVNESSAEEVRFLLEATRAEFASVKLERRNALGKEETRTIFQEFRELMFQLLGEGRG